MQEENEENLKNKAKTRGQQIEELKNCYDTAEMKKSIEVVKRNMKEGKDLLKKFSEFVEIPDEKYEGKYAKEERIRALRIIEPFQESKKNLQNDIKEFEEICRDRTKDKKFRKAVKTKMIPYFKHLIDVVDILIEKSLSISEITIQMAAMADQVDLAELRYAKSKGYDSYEKMIEARKQNEKIKKQDAIFRATVARKKIEIDLEKLEEELSIVSFEVIPLWKKEDKEDLTTEVIMRFQTEAGQQMEHSFGGLLTTNQLTEQLRELADRFDVDQHVEQFIAKRGQDGVPKTTAELLKDAESLKIRYQYIAEVAEREFPLQAKEPVEEPEQEFREN